MSFGGGYFSLGKKVPLGRISRQEFLTHRRTDTDGHQFNLFSSLYRPDLWTKFHPKLASKMGTYVSHDFFLTTEFACTYVCRMYCEIFVWVIFRVIQLILKPPMMGFVIGSHRGASLCRLIVHHIYSQYCNKTKYGIAILMIQATHINDSFIKYLFS